MVRGNDISLSLSGKLILKGVSFDIIPGRITTFIGVSGAGKSTLLRCMTGLENHFQGTIAVDGRDVRMLSPQERASSIGFVFQQFNLFPQLTALQNCMQPLQIVMGMPEAQARATALMTLAKLGMESFAKSYPSQLSGGQQQRVAIARPLCLGPKVLVLDEPTSSLDPGNTRSFANLLKTLCEQGITIAVASQDMSFVRLIQDRVYLLEEGEVIEMIEGDQTESTKVNQFLNM